MNASKIIVAITAATALAFSMQAEAKRFGGFRSKPNMSRPAPAQKPVPTPAQPSEVVVKDGTSIGRSMAVSAAGGLAAGAGVALGAGAVQAAAKKNVDCSKTAEYKANPDICGK
jgi:hypothetical protein